METNYTNRHLCAVYTTHEKAVTALLREYGSDDQRIRCKTGHYDGKAVLWDRWGDGGKWLIFLAPCEDRTEASVFEWTDRNTINWDNKTQ